RARELAGAAAIWGRRLDEAALAALCAPGFDEAALQELVQGSILEPVAGGTQLQFVHDQLRAAAVEALAAGRRRALHRRAAERLAAEQDPERLAELALHWERAGLRSRARPAVLAAARHEAARYSFREAERLYQDFLRLTLRPTRQSRRARLEL